MNVYQGNFDCWDDVIKSFNGNVKEPSEVFLAKYDIDGYEGSAQVFWRQGRKYYYLCGSHCSCFGLEETGWDPEEFKNKKLFVEFIKKARTGFYGLTDEDVECILNKLKVK